MAQGHLRVTVVEAAKLDDKDKSDFNDPYVEVYIDEAKKHKTRTFSNEERPKWNETFELYTDILFYFFSLQCNLFYIVICGQVMNMFL